MLKIYFFTIETLKLLQPVSVSISRSDADLARQMRRAMTSIALNLAEGVNSRGRNRQARYNTALGSAQETLACMDVAAALLYIDPPPEELVDRMDRIVRTLVKLSR